MAKQFKFRLEPILRLRQMKEDDKKRGVGELVAEINQYQQEALDMATQIRQEGQTLTGRLQGEVDVNYIAHYHRYVRNLQYCIQKKIANVGEVQQKLAPAREALAEASRQTKILEKLKAKKKKQYMDEFRHQENRELDEIATMAYVHDKKRNETG